MTVKTGLLVLCGPTCTGKTAAAIELAEQLGDEIVAADSRTIYRLMDIGTAKPTAAQRACVPHHLLDVADPGDVFTVARFRTLARRAIADIGARGKRPLIVGGTGLYIRAVTDDLSIPEVPPRWDLRARLESTEHEDPGVLHRRLSEVDPAAAARIHPRNIRRLIRALEVFEVTGRPISVQQRAGGEPLAATRFGLTVDRPVLYERIDERCDQQIAAGLAGEVQHLLEAGYSPALPSMQGLGYKEIVGYLQGKTTLEAAIGLLRRNTHRFAKRQLTWFRSDPRIRWIDATHATSIEVAANIAAMLE